MSRVIAPNECNCDCHRNPHVMHVAACCEGECPTCKKFIARGQMEEHRKTCGIHMPTFWNEHAANVRPSIKELDRKQVEAMARAPFIVVTNTTK